MMDQMRRLASQSKVGKSWLKIDKKGDFLAMARE